MAYKNSLFIIAFVVILGAFVPRVGTARPPCLYWSHCGASKGGAVPITMTNSKGT